MGRHVQEDVSVSSNITLGDNKPLYLNDLKTKYLQWNSTAARAEIISSVYISDSFTLGTLSGVLKATAGLISGSATLDDISDGVTYVRISSTNKSNYDSAYSHKTTEDALNGLVKVNGAGVYSAVTDNSSNWDSAYGWGDHALAGYFVKASDDLDDISAGTTNVHLTTVLKGNYDSAYNHSTASSGTIHGLTWSNVVTSVTPTNISASIANNVLTISNPQGISSSDSPTFAGLSLTGIASYNSHPSFTLDTQIVDKKYVDDAVSIENLWNRTSTTLHPHNNGDSLEIRDGTGTVLFTISGSTGIASYSSHPTFSSNTQLVDKKYVDDATSGGNIWNRIGTTISQYNAGDSLELLNNDVTPSTIFSVNGVTGSTYIAGSLTLNGLTGVLKATLGIVSGSATTDDLTQGISNFYYADSLARAAISSSATGLTYTSATGVFSLTSGYEIPSTTKTGNWDSAYGWGDHALAGYFVKASDDLDDISAGTNNVHLTISLKSNYDTAYNHSSASSGTIHGLTWSNVVSSVSPTDITASITNNVLTISNPQGLATTSIPTFAGLILTGLARYNVHPTFTLDTHLVDKKYVDDVVGSGIWLRSLGTIRQYNYGDSLELYNNDVTPTVVFSVEGSTGSTYIAGTLTLNGLTGVVKSVGGTLTSDATMDDILDGATYTRISISDKSDYDAAYSHSQANSGTIHGLTWSNVVTSVTPTNISASIANNVLTISNPQGISSSDSPTFAGLTLSGIASYSYLPSFTLDSQIVNKKYVDDAIAVENLWDRSGTVLRQRYFGDSLELYNNDATPSIIFSVEGFAGNTYVGGFLTLNQLASYLVHPTFSSDTQLVDKKYVDDAIAVENLWDRSGTVLRQYNYGDSLELYNNDVTPTVVFSVDGSTGATIIRDKVEIESYSVATSVISEFAFSPSVVALYSNMTGNVSGANNIGILGVAQNAVLGSNVGISGSGYSNSLADGIGVYGQGTCNSNNSTVTGVSGAVWAIGAYVPDYDYGVDGAAGLGVLQSIGVRGRTNSTGVANYGGYFNATGAGTTNYGIYASALNGTNNYAAYFEGACYVEVTAGLSRALSISSSSITTETFASNPTAFGLKVHKSGALSAPGYNMAICATATGDTDSSPVGIYANAHLLTGTAGIAYGAMFSAGHHDAGGFVGAYGIFVNTYNALSQTGIYYSGSGEALGELKGISLAIAGVGNTKYGIDINLSGNSVISYGSNTILSGGADTTNLYGDYLDVTGLSTTVLTAGTYAIVKGNSPNSCAVFGQSLAIGTDSWAGCFQNDAATTNTAVGCYGQSIGAGVANYGIRGLATSATTNYGVYGEASGGTTNYAGYFVGNVKIDGRLLGYQGVDVASANDITLGQGNYFDITGTTQINRIASAGWTAGSRVVLQFDGVVTVKDAQASGGGYASILISSSSDYISAAGSMVEIIFDGTNWKLYPIFAE